MASRYVVQLDVFRDPIEGDWTAAAGIVDGWSAEAHGSTPGIAAARAVRRAIEATRKSAPHAHDIDAQDAGVRHG